MARKVLKLYYGSPLTLLADLNDGTNYAGRSVGLFATPESTYELADAAYGTPYLNRVKTKERAFSLLVTIKSEPYTTPFFDALRSLNSACYLEDSNGKQLPVRVVVSRAGIGNKFVDAYVENIHPVSEEDPSQYEILLTAVDPYLTYGYNLVDGPEPDTTTGTTGSNPSLDYALTMPSYRGTAVGEPKLELVVGGNGGVYRYYRDIVITNNAAYPLIYHPICIDLGDISALVGTKFHEIGGGDRRLRDIRIETLGGARKVIFVRDSGQAGGTWHQSVKVWVVLYSLQPGQSKTLRVLYGNATAPVSEVDETPNSTIRPMFNMFNSNNGSWEYVDFLPGPTLPQTRAAEWSAFVPGSTNITWIGYQHPHFDTGTPGNVGCAGAKALYLAPAVGFVGVQLHTPVPPSSVSATWRASTNLKAPFVLRSQRPDGRFVDDWAFPNGTTNFDSTVITTVKFNVAAGDVSFETDSISRADATLLVGDTINIDRDDGTNHRATITSITSSFGVYTVGFTPAIGGTGGSIAASAGNNVQQNYAATNVKSWTLGDQPLRIVFGLRADTNFNLGDWYYGATDFLTITWESTKKPGVTVWGSATEVDLTVTGFQMKGRFGNSTIGEYIGINTVVPTILDKLVIDCKARTCQYFHWNGASYDPAEDRMEALRFDAVRRYWVHVVPLGGAQDIRFIADVQSLLINLGVTVTTPVRFLA